MDKYCYVLHGAASTLGVYSSKKNLAKGVNYWMKQRPKYILSFEEREMNYSPEASSWGWCYIPLGINVKRLTKGGADFIPMRKYFGHNLIELGLRGIEYSYEYSEGKDPSIP